MLWKNGRFFSGQESSFKASQKPKKSAGEIKVGSILEVTHSDGIMYGRVVGKNVLFNYEFGVEDFFKLSNNKRIESIMPDKFTSLT